MLGSDAVSDVMPSGYEGLMLPVHVGTLVMQGIHLIDNGDFDSLAEKAQEAFALRIHVHHGAADPRTRHRLAGQSDRDFLVFDGERIMPAEALVIDADGHILEPPDLWEKYIDPKYRERAMRIRVGEDGYEYLEIDQQARQDDPTRRARLARRNG